MNKRGSWGELFFVLAMIFIVILLILAAVIRIQTSVKQCTTVCERKSMDYWRRGTHHRDCECITDDGDLVVVKR